MAALKEHLRRSAAVLPSDFSRDSDRVAVLNSTPPSDISEDGASEQANVDGVMEFSNNEIFDQVSFHFKSDAGSSLANLGEEEPSDIGGLLGLKLEGRRASVMRLAITRKLKKMELTGRLGHLLFLRSPVGELIGTAPSSTPFVAATASSPAGEVNGIAPSATPFVAVTAVADTVRDDHSTASSITDGSPDCVAQEVLRAAAADSDLALTLRMSAFRTMGHDAPSTLELTKEQ